MTNRLTNRGAPRPRVLVLVTRLPSPPVGGGDLRALQTINCLARYAEVAVFGLEAGREGPPPGIEVWRSSSDRSVADPSKAAAISLNWLGEPDGHPYGRYVTDTVIRELESLVADFRPDVAVVESLTLAEYIEVFSAAGVRVVLSAHNVEARLQRELLGSIGKNLPRALASRLAESVERFERKAFSAVDAIWACSDADAALIHATYPSAAPTRVVGNSVDVASYAASDEAAERGHRVIFPAQFAYPPNAAAAVWLARELLPLLRRRFTDAEIVLAGAQPTQEMLDLAASERAITVTGFVADMRPQLEAAAAMAVPLFQGGGTRFKVLEALASRLPVVSTLKGVEGLAVRADEHFLRAETPLEFADGLERLWTRPAERERIVEAGARLVEERYSWEAAAREMEAGLRELIPSA
jgi:glycosyltransferase involved in cell wall biosynthesis